VGPFVAAPLGVLALFVAPPPNARAQPRETPPAVHVVEVEGVIDSILADYVRTSVEAAEEQGAAVVLQIDSRGSFGDEGLRLGRFLRRSRVPVIAWVGPAGARAAGGALFVVYGSGLSAMAPGAGIGPARPFDLGTGAGDETPSAVSEGRRELAALALGSGATGAGIMALVDGSAFPAGEARDAGAVALVAPVAEDSPGVAGVLSAIDGLEVDTSAGPVTLRTEDRAGRRVDIRVQGLGPVRRVLHAAGTPTAFYVLVLVGLWCVAFELTQPGVGVAGIAGVLAIAFAGYSLTVIPVNWLGLALVLGGTALQALDVMLRRLAVLTFTGTAMFAAGSLLAWSHVASAVDVSPWLIGLATLASFLFFGFALTVAIRARERVRSSQVALVGLVGEARGDLDPEGAVHVKGTLWRARTMDGRIPKGARVRVRGIDGLILRVDREPD
jgi:membrane-bound serine protease (ClpP class)